MDKRQVTFWLMLVAGGCAIIGGSLVLIGDMQEGASLGAIVWHLTPPVGLAALTVYNWYRARKRPVPKA